MEENKEKQVGLTGIIIRGMAMGIADLVPGVSGGTIAFISGIYQRLLSAIKGLPELIGIALKEGIPAAWKKGDLSFLFFLFAGILSSVLLFSKLLSFLLDNHATLVWAFFFGLILGSIVMVAKTIPVWNTSTWLSLFAGVLAGLYLTLLAPVQWPNSYPFIFLSGAIAICAMILPGISGSFILLLIGKYHFIVDSLKSKDISVILTFALGCIIGLLGFSRVINWAFKRFPVLITALLTGFMAGSLNKVWPWKITIVYSKKSPDKDIWIPLIEQNVSPLSVESPQLLLCTLLALSGAALMLLLMRFLPNTPINKS
jgi:putative membrane protein